MTKRKLALIIVAAILGAILIAISICAIIANSKNDDSKPTAELASWQSMIKDETLLKDVVIAGAHDAGTKGLPYFAETQDRDVSDLLNCGTRYLDLRVSYAGGKLQIYHGPSKGVALADVLEQVRSFVTTNASECVILDFQHFDEKELEAQNGAIRLVEETMLDLLVTNNGDKSDLDYIDGLTMGEVRGKCLVTWGWENDEVIAKKYAFKRDNDVGGRKNSVLHSFYDGNLNKKSSQTYIEEAIPYYLNKYKELQVNNDSFAKGLRILQGQLTDGLYVFGPHLREATHTDNMDNYLDGLKTSDDLQYINIVIRDFVTPSKSCHTLQLNLTKGTVKTDSVATFEKMIADNMK